MSAELKANKTTRNKKSGGCILQILIKKYFQKGNSMSNHPIFLDVDTLTSQILFIFFTICR